MRILTRKSGSALLTVLLLMTALSATTLYVFRDALSIGRQVIVQSDATVASQMAQSALEQGLLLIKTAGPAAEFGDATVVAPDTYALVSKVRGFQPTASGKCSAFTAGTFNWSDIASINQGCPYYSLAIRKNANVTAANFGKFSITPDLLPVGQPVTIAIPSSDGTSYLVALDSATPSSSTLDVTANGTTQVLSPGSVLSIAGSASSLTLKANGPLKGRGIYLHSYGGAGMVIGRGATIIEATGYAGGVQRKLLLTIPSYDPSKAWLAPFAGGFDADGLPAR